MNRAAHALHQAAPATVESTPFGTTTDGVCVDVYMLRNANGIEVAITNFGGTIVALRTPDRAGRLEDIVLGFDALEHYTSSESYFGAIIGRYSNRIARGSFTLDGVTSALALNDGVNHLHGGVRGFGKVVWSAESFDTGTERGVILHHRSADGEEGYPGALTVAVRYLLTDTNELVVDYRATTDRATPVNLTQHSCFNLAGAGNGDILDHVLMIAASAYTPVDATLIPTGELTMVDGTPFDFRAPVRVGSRINANDPQLGRARGYDHNFVLDRTLAETVGAAARGAVVFAARVAEPLSGRTLEVHTTEPGIQFYSGNALDGTIIGKGGRAYGRHSGFCLETQHFPDSPNQPTFPSTTLRPGEEYRSTTVFVFGVTD